MQGHTGDGRMGCSVQVDGICDLEPFLLPVGCSLHCGHEASLSVSALRAGKSSYRAFDESQRFLLRSAGPPRPRPGNAPPETVLRAAKNWGAQLPPKGLHAPPQALKTKSNSARAPK